MNPIASGTFVDGLESGSQPGRPRLSIRSIFSANRWSITATYLLFNIENVLRMAQPLVLGWAINNLLSGSMTGFWWLIAQHVSHAAIGTVRQAYDTRVFGRITADIASDLVERQRQQQVEVSRIAARSVLSREYVEFFERYMPLVIRSAYSVIGAVLMLGFYDLWLVPLCVGLFLPAAWINARYARKTRRLSRRLHDQMENEVEVLRDGSPDDVRRHFDHLARSRVRLSDAEAINFGTMELFVMALIAATLLRFSNGDSTLPGDVFAVFRYVMLFVMGLDSVPKVVAQTSRLRDIGRRMG